MDEPLEYVGFWARVLAALIDSILIAIVTAPLLYSVYGAGYWNSEDWIQGGWDFLLSWVFPVAAVILFWTYKSATPGKMAISAVIVDARTGGRPSIGQWIGRYLAYIIAFVPLGLGVLWVAFDRRKQGWHDKLAKTVVVYKHSSRFHPEHPVD